MCGITGFIDHSKQFNKELLAQMAISIKHRGPDDIGTEIFSFEDAVVGLAQTRLSIIDLSSGGHQPMSFLNFSIVFNGEIYNYKEIKNDLISKGHRFITDSDTEVILHSFKEWGVKCVDRFTGMFTFVILDSLEQKLWIFRDRAGVKPLYYSKQGNYIFFGSELKTLMANKYFSKVIDVNVLPNYFQYGYIAAPHTIFKNTFKLCPGNFIEFDLRSKNISIHQYWSLNKFYEKPKLKIDYSEAKEELRSKLTKAFEYRMISDVPVGVFLSGGYDSTLVASILQKNRTDKLKTFTIGFEEGNNEAPYAAQTAKILGTDHTEYICTTKEAKQIIPELPFFFDEPFGDSSAIPTLLVSRIASKEVTVALSADGGDELFGGYNSYFKLQTNISRAKQFPKIVLPGNNVLKLLSKVNKFESSKYFHYLDTFSKTKTFENINSLSAFLHQRMVEKPNSYISSIFSQSLSGYDSSYKIETSHFNHYLEVAFCADFNSYLPNDILTKVDRATMANSIEGREPLLDHHLAEFASQLPLHFKTDGLTGKLIIKDIVHDYISEVLMNRPKTGFSLPIYNWLRNDLSYLLDEYLSEEALGETGIFNVEFLKFEIDKFKQNKLHYSAIIWYLLMFQMWYFRWIKGVNPSAQK